MSVNTSRLNSSCPIRRAPSVDDANRTAPRRPDTRILRSAVSDFLAACWDLVANEIAKSRYMTGAQMSFPLVIRTANGGGSQPALHRRGEPQALWQGSRDRVDRRRGRHHPVGAAHRRYHPKHGQPMTDITGRPAMPPRPRQEN